MMLNKIGKYKLLNGSPLSNFIHNKKPKSNFKLKTKKELEGNPLIQLYESNLQNLTEADFNSFIRFGNFSKNLSMSLILYFYNSEIRNQYKNLPFSKQFQVGMRSFCVVPGIRSRKNVHRGRCLWNLLMEAQKLRLGTNQGCLYPSEIASEYRPYYKEYQELDAKYHYKGAG